MSQWDFGGQPAGPSAGRGEYDEYGEFVHSDGFEGGNFSDDFEGGNFTPISYERDPYPLDASGWPYDRQDYDEPRQDTAPLRQRSRAGWPDESWPPRVQRRAARPRWLIAVAVAVAAALAGSSVVLLSGGGHPAGRAAGPGAPSVTARPTATATATAGGQQPLTMAQARQVLAGYTTANNRANARMSDALLAAIETGSSYAIDAGIYRVQRAEKAAPYPAFGPRQSLFYIPRQPSAMYPHWFVVQVVNASLASGKAGGTEYLVFTQATPGARWRNTIEPYVVSGAVTPRVAVGADGLATPVSGSGAPLAVPPAVISQLTAASLDGGKGGPASPGNLADRLDQKYWHRQLPSATVLDRHLPAPDQVFGLRTADGGALLFYTDSAMLTLVPPAGEAMHLTIPGFFSPGHAVTAAEIGYLEQFAAYVPPRGGSGLRVVADYSGMTAKY